MQATLLCIRDASRHARALPAFCSGVDASRSGPSSGSGSGARSGARFSFRFGSFGFFLVEPVRFLGFLAGCICDSAGIGERFPSCGSAGIGERFPSPIFFLSDSTDCSSGAECGRSWPRFQVPDSLHRFPIRFLTRFQVPGSRFQVPGSRFQVPGSRFQVPDSRLRHALCRGHKRSLSVALRA